MTIKAKNHTLYVCVTAMFGALLVGGKHALALVPNVEIVTLIVAVCAEVMKYLIKYIEKTGEKIVYG